MVRAVTAYAAEDGSIHPTPLAAAKHDFFQRLTGGENFKHETVQGIYERRRLTAEALATLIKAEDEAAAEANVAAAPKADVTDGGGA